MKGIKHNLQLICLDAGWLGEAIHQQFANFFNLHNFNGNANVQINKI